MKTINTVSYLLIQKPDLKAFRKSKTEIFIQYLLK